MFFKKKNKKEDNISTELRDKEKENKDYSIIKEGKDGTELHCFIDLAGSDSKDKELPEPKPEEKYIWVEGYKGTDKDMICKILNHPVIIRTYADTSYRTVDHTKYCYNTQYYELNKEVSLKDDEEPVLCKKGFHFCLNLKDVFGYYTYDFSNRYFKVKAYVKESDYNSVKDSKDTKLAAKKIILYEEVFPEYDDVKKYLIYKYVTSNNDIYTYQVPKELFEEIKKSDLSFNDFMYKYVSDEMLNLGYSTTFTMLLVDRCKDEIGNINIARAMNMYTLAKAFKEENVSPDMSVYMLLNHSENK